MTLGECPDRFEETFWESDTLRNLRRAAEARGMAFYVDPPRDVVPRFLGRHRPDAMARGADGGIIIEVVHRRNGAAEQHLAEISRIVSQQKGWEFLAVHLNPSAGRARPMAKPTWPQLQDALRETEALANGGHHAAALVSMWAALEALARLARADGESDAPGAMSPVQAVQALAEEGFVENEVADRFREAAGLRHAVVHGDFSVDVLPDQVQALVQDLRSIASQVRLAV